MSNDQQQKQLANEAALQLPDVVASQDLDGPEPALQLMLETTAAVVQLDFNTASRARSSPAVPLVARGSPALAVIHEDSSPDQPVQLDSVADLPHSADPAAEDGSRVKVRHSSETSMLCSSWHA